ncbi:S-layer homology domain protein [Brevibacillus laterosporus GI-9]|uniref:S-layer homology domain-containing protein n=1 Tax=Brevibacillus laterosporus TaxID=1465 RepID=UPI00024051FB|nr:S-layer homology domain-containing protein [Brevibacillus laterosporus]CCF16502.1 S-layer homology domain protein [Brevibacillus laterosporus GI-9]
MKKWSKNIVLLGVCTALSVSSVAYADLKDTNKHWANQTIDWAVFQKFVDGYPDGSFRPDKSVTEAEFLKLVLKMYKPNDFHTTEAETHWADNYYRFANTFNYPVEGLINLQMRDTYITRQQVANIIVGTQGFNYIGNDAVQFLLGKGLAKGKKGQTIEGFEPGAYLTRAEAVQFLKNLKEAGNTTLQARPKILSDQKSLPEIIKTSFNKKYEEISKNIALLKDRNTLINFIRSFSSYDQIGEIRGGFTNQDVVIGKSSKYEYSIYMEYSDEYTPSFGIMVPELREKEKLFVKDILKVFYPTSYEKTYQDVITASNWKTIPEKNYIEKQYDARNFRVVKGSSGGIAIWVGTK